MSGKHATISQIKEAVALRSAGLTRAAIAEKTGLSISTVGRIANRFKARKGSSIDRVVATAHNELLEQLNDNEALRLEIAKLMLEDMALNRLLREKLAETLSILPTDDPDTAAVNLRALNSAASAALTAQKAARIAVGADNEVVTESSLPVLRIEEMTAEDIEEVRRQQRSFQEELDDDEPRLTH